MNSGWGLVVVGALALTGCGDDTDTGSGGGGTGGDGSTTTTGDGGGTTTSTTSTSSGGVGADSLSLTGTLDGEAFTIECANRPTSLYSTSGAYDWLCNDSTGTFTGPVYQVNIQGPNWSLGEQTLAAGGPGPVISIARGSDFKNFATSLAASGGLTVDVEAADEERFAGTIDGSWVQEGITVEMSGAFDFSVNVM